MVGRKGKSGGKRSNPGGRPRTSNTFGPPDRNNPQNLTNHFRPFARTSTSTRPQSRDGTERNSTHSSQSNLNTSSSSTSVAAGTPTLINRRVNTATHSFGSSMASGLSRERKRQRQQQSTSVPRQSSTATKKQRSSLTPPTIIDLDLLLIHLLQPLHHGYMSESNDCARDSALHNNPPKNNDVDDTVHGSVFYKGKRTSKYLNMRTQKQLLTDNNAYITL